MWDVEHTETTSASPDRLWARYADPVTWPTWDHEIAAVSVDGPMTVGARGRLKPVQGPSSRFTFTEVTPGVGFTDVSRLPLARLSFIHGIDRTATGSRFTHRVIIDGPLSWLFARLIGPRLATGLPTAMRSLARLAESVDEPTAPTR